LLLWQPVTSGQQHLTQFLRLRAAAEMLDARQARGVVTGLKQSLSRGDSVTVAGYTLNPDLANPLAAARVELPNRFAAPVALQEIVPDATSMPAAALGQLREAWTKQGIHVRYGQITGPSFWRTVEVETAPALIPETVRAVQSMTS
jgi:exosortase A-associated hydrolase 2